jgi:hypothetical protein
VSRVVLLLALCGCRQLLGFESAGTPSGGDAAIDMTSDMPADMRDATLTPVTHSFQHGVDGYLGVLDTYVENGSNQNNGADQGLRAKQNQRWAMIQFQDLFVSQGGPIPDDAPITEAHLDVVVMQQNNECTLHDILVSWSDTATFDLLGMTPGVTSGDDYEPVKAADCPTTTGPATIVVTSSLETWSATATKNRGWMVVVNNGAGDNTYSSSEVSTVADRPRLTVTWLQ